MVDRLLFELGFTLVVFVCFWDREKVVSGMGHLLFFILAIGLDYFGQSYAAAFRLLGKSLVDRGFFFSFGLRGGGGGQCWGGVEVGEGRARGEIGVWVVGGVF